MKETNNKVVMKKKDLLNGKEFEFVNEDKYLSANVLYSDKLGKFVIWFNGVIFHSSKTFNSLNNKLSQLKEKYNLTLK